VRGETCFLLRDLGKGRLSLSLWPAAAPPSPFASLPWEPLCSPDLALTLLPRWEGSREYRYSGKHLLVISTLLLTYVRYDGGLKMDRETLKQQIANMQYQAKMERWPLSKSIDAWVISPLKYESKGSLWVFLAKVELFIEKRAIDNLVVFSTFSSTFAWNELFDDNKMSQVCEASVTLAKVYLLTLMPSSRDWTLFNSLFYMLRKHSS